MALFTDYHVGKSRDLFYTTVVDEYMDWFCTLVQNDSSIDCIGFLGDWHEFRNTIYIDVLNQSHRLITKLNNLGKPVFFIVGNHDLFNRASRDIHSCVFFQQFSNITVISQPVIFNNFDGNVLFSPFLFHSEYDQALANQPVQHLLGHFEFKDFVITGYNVKMEDGPDCTQFAEYRNILSGHFHKRQRQNNVQFIGNTFCTSYADADDTHRGACVYEFDKAKLTFHNWAGSPRYVKTTLSDIMDGKLRTSLNERTFVQCTTDVEITYEDQIELEKTFKRDFGVRVVEFADDDRVLKQMIMDTIPGIDSEQMKTMSTEELIYHMLTQVKVDTIDNGRLLDIYRKL